MSIIATGTKLWVNGELVTGTCTTSVNCDQLSGSTPRPATLVPTGGCCGSVQYGLVLGVPDPLPLGSLQGVWVEFKDGSGMVLDAISADAVRDACNACCGTTPVIAPLYGGTLPVPPPDVAATYTFTREDLGTSLALQTASLDYWPNYIAGTFNRTSYNTGTGVSTYTFQAYKDPVYIAGDTQTGETARVFVSNAAPTLPVDSVYNVTVYANGVLVTPTAPVTAASVALLLTGIQGDANYAALGTWAANGVDKVQLSTTTQNPVVITIGTEPTP